VGAGVYTVNISDVNSCVITKTITVSQPDIVVVTTSITSNYNGQNISCFGLTDGSAIVNAIGGTTPYSYVWTDASAQSTSTLSNVGQGTYSVTVTDVNGCNITKDVTLVEPSQVNSIITITSSHNGKDISCFGLTDGSAAVEVGGGTPGYTYSWTTASTNTLSNVSNIGAGTYTVTIKDKNNCTITNTVTLTEPASVTATAVVTSNYNGQNISCFGYTNGEATVSAIGGTTPYSYSWNSVPTQTNAIATGLAVGNYSVVVRDINNCLITTTVTLTQPTAIVSTETVISNFNGRQVSCFAATDATITSVAINGTGPYTYTWTNTATTGTVLPNVGAGVYTVNISDVNSCVITKTITVSQPDIVVATTSITSNYNGQNISCFGLTDGSAIVNVGGGTSPYTYTWTGVPTQTTAALSNVGQGIYSVTVTDVNGCNVITSIALTQPTRVDADLISVSDYNGFNVKCKGNTNAFIDISTNGGTTQTTYAYSWSNGQSSQDLNNIGAGSYTVMVSDINNCKDSLVVNIDEPNPLIVTLDSLSDYNGFNISCNGLQDGATYISTTGGVINYTYTWSNNTSNEDLLNVGVGVYSVLVTDKNACTAALTATITQPTPITFTNNQVAPTCYGLSNGALDVTLSGGVTPYAYNWSNGGTNEDLKDVTAGTYTLSYQDINGCGQSVVFNISNPDPIMINKIVNNIKCYGDSIGSITLSPYGGTGAFTYTWSNGSSTKDLTNIKSGQYIVTVTDNNSCSVIDTTIIYQPDLLTVSLYSPISFSGYNVSSYQGTDGSIDATVNGGTIPYTYLWSNGSSTEDLNNLAFGNYIVTVIDTNGCKASASIILTQPLVLEMPQGYSPNKDSKNDFFVVHGIEAYPNNVLTIYNRWGNIVYSKEGYLNEWEGLSNNGEKLPDATYFAILEVNSGEIVLKGFVELRR
jgi:gliding motility-associated-like protein